MSVLIISCTSKAMSYGWVFHYSIKHAVKMKFTVLKHKSITFNEKLKPGLGINLAGMSMTVTNDKNIRQ